MNNKTTNCKNCDTKPVKKSSASKRGSKDCSGCSKSK